DCGFKSPPVRPITATTMSQNKTAKLRRRRERRSRSLRDQQQPDSDRILFEQAVNWQQNGKLDRAKEAYVELLSKSPGHARAWHMLGMTLYAANENASAKDCLGKTIEIEGLRAEVAEHLSLIEHALGQSDDAIKLLVDVLAENPQNRGARNNLGVILLETGMFGEAEVQFQMVLREHPEDQNAAMNLANCLVRQNRLHDAEGLYRNLLSDAPNNLDVLGNLGECLRRQCKWDAALEVLQKVVDARSDDYVTRLTLARTYVCRGDLATARAQFEQLVEDYPNRSKPRHYLGTTLVDLKEFDEAEREIRRAIEIDPADSHALCSLGFLLIETDRRREALECFERAVRQNPKMHEAHGCMLYLMSGDPDLTAEEVFEEHVRWGKLHGQVPVITAHDNDRSPNRRLRIGYVSADLRRHAVAAFFEPLLRLRDEEGFETYCYYEHAIEDDVTQQLKGLSDHWRSTHGFSDEQVLKQIRLDNIDILIDLSGHTSGNRLKMFARRPAPLQISWLGYPNTTGLDTIDYCLTCDVQNPVGEPPLHTEQLIRIPGGSFCFHAPSNAPPLSSLPALQRNQITIGSLHRPFKVSSKTHDLWAAAMHACSDARLLLFNTRFNDSLKAEHRKALIQRGVASDRIEIRNATEAESYLEIYSEIDIGLDATPWAGGTTTMEALWMGVPVVAYYGNNRPSRGTAGIVHHLGHPEWIARSEREYGQLVSSLATDIPKLSHIRGSLREETLRTIADEQRFVTELESSYREIWRRWCEKQPPITFSSAAYSVEQATTTI
ncbi:MAG: tetratricopeptide repeat protein, partial [Planctomycetota bacterium]